MLMRGLYDIFEDVSRSIEGVVLFNYGGCRIKLIQDSAWH